VGGTGSGEATLNRTHSTMTEQSSDARANLFAGGFEYLAYQAAAFDLSIVGNAGSASISLDEDSGLLSGREGSSGKASLGGDISFVRDLEEGSMATSLSLRAASDSGDGETGTGLEAGGAVSYWGANFDFHLGGKVVAAHSGESVKRASFTARIRYKATSDGTGLGIYVAPNLGMDHMQGSGLFNEEMRIADLRRNLSAQSEPSIESAVSYGILVRNQSFLLTPSLKLEKAHRDLERISLNAHFRPVGQQQQALSWMLGVQSIERSGDSASLGFITRLQLRL
ncbi:MAG: hypothetical protein OXC80_03850, partial [Gammaproteobacteria bacterium]|nr:hypothetical protein [Gammaproteobacteria bacterium]